MMPVIFALFVLCVNGRSGLDAGGVRCSSKSELELPRCERAEWLAVEKPETSVSSLSISSRCEIFENGSRADFFLLLLWKLGFCGDDNVSTGRNGARCFLGLLFMNFSLD